jgi:predicted nucleic acid-binding protein
MCDTATELLLSSDLRGSATPGGLAFNTLTREEEKLEATVNRYVIDASVVLYLLSEEVEVSEEHKLLAPTLIRSQVLSELYKAVRSGEIAESVGHDRLSRFARMKIRYLGDKVLRRQAWSVAEQLGWDSTEDAEYIALTQLQGDAFVTMNEDLERSASQIIETASFDSLL